MRIHTFGDSHSMFGWQQVKEQNLLPVELSINHLGPRLMYTFGKCKLDVLNLSSYDIQDGDAVVFCFGEIDCRCHLYKFHNDHKQRILSMVSDYMEAVDLNIVTIFPKRIRPIVYGILPTVRKDLEKEREHPDYPFLGEDEDRKRYIFLMNKALAEQCEHRKYVFMNLHDQLADKEGFLLPPPAGDGTVHIGDPGPIVEFLKPVILCGSIKCTVT